MSCIDLGWLAMWHRHRPGAEPAYSPCLPRFFVHLGSELAKHSSQAHVGEPRSAKAFLLDGGSVITFHCGKDH